MAVNKSRKNLDNERPVKEASTGASAGTVKTVSAEIEREKALSRLHPSAVEYVKRNLGIDLKSPQTSLSVIHDLAQGRYTEPVAVTVTPRGYDRVARKTVSLPPVTALVSLRIDFPREGGKPVAIDKKHPAYLSSVSVRPEVLKGAAPQVSRTEEPGSDSSKLTFTDAQILALEGAGIEPDRLFGSNGSLSAADKESLLAGAPVEIEGSVRLEGGERVNIHGEVELDGEKAVFRSSVMRRLQDKSLVPALASVPEDEFEGLKRSDFQIDIAEARRQGSVDFDLYEKGPDGKTLSTAEGPVLNPAGRDLLTFGSSMGPVRGFIHFRNYDKASGKWAEGVETAWYHLTVINGNIAATRMRRDAVMGKDGEKTYSAPHVNPRLDSEGRVYVSGGREPLSFASDEEFDRYRAGKPAKVKDARHHDFKLGKDITYDAYVVFDGASGGFAKQFSPSSSKKIEELIRKRESRKTHLKSKSFGI